MQDSERQLMCTTLRRLAEDFTDAELSRVLAEFGYADLLAEEPREAVSSLFDAVGHAGSTSSALQDVLLSPLVDVLPDLIDEYSVVLPVVGAHLAGILDGHRISLHGIVIGLRPATAFLAAVALGNGTAWVRFDDTSDVTTRVVAGLDPTLTMTEVTATGAQAEVLLTGDIAAARWDAAVAAGRRALGYQIVGAVGRMIELAVGHARDRVQFGKPIGTFQGVRNRLAEAYVARAGAAAALELAWDADDEYLAAMLAKSLAGRAARIAATHCQQVLAGVGFTAEHPFHRFLLRASVLDSVFGSAAELPGAIGAHLVSTGAVPRLVQL